ncbi:MAG: TonB-dependent receptor [Bacteroidales bacterium]|nr:TonB-dependent receptor [Bacteroidales bacterium]
MVRIFSILLFVLINTSAFSQQLSGHVFDAKIDQPLSDVNITVEGENIGAKSDSLGFFSIGQIGPGDYLLRATAVGFLDFEKRIELKPDAELEINIYLQPVNIRLGDEVVISARRIESLEFQAPEAITVINNQTISNESARTVPEALSGATAVFIQKTNHGGGSPFVRGLTGNQTLTMVDGVRLNNATFRYGPNQYLATVDPYVADRIEIVRGSGSVLYGSDALGGVVHLFTRNPTFRQKGFKIGGNIYGKWISDDMEKTTRGELELAGKKVTFLGGITYNDFGDIVAGEGIGEEHPTGYSGISGDGKFRMMLDRQKELVMVYQYSKQEDVPRYDKIITGYEKYHFDPQIRQLGYLQLKTINENKWIKKINYLISYGQSDETRLLKKEGQEKITTEQDVVDTFGGSVEISSAPSDTWNFTSGVDFYYDKVGSSKIENQNGNITEKRGYYPDGSTSASFALFSSHAITLNKFILTLGARVNANQISVEDAVFGDVDSRPVALVGNASVAYKLTENYQLIGSAYSAFRAPNINDLSSFGSFNYGIEVPNPDLDPEESFTAEMGLKSRYERFTGAIFIFQNNLNNLIERAPATWNGQDSIDGEKVYRKENFAKAYIRGIEVNGQYEVTAGLMASGNMTYTYGQNKTLDEPMTRIPPLFGRIGIRYSHHSGFWSLLELLSAGKQDRLSEGDKNDSRIPDGGTPGWNVLNLRFGYQWKFAEITAGLNNMFNEAFRTHGSGVDGYGRSFWIGLKIGF